MREYTVYLVEEGKDGVTEELMIFRQKREKLVALLASIKEKFGSSIVVGTPEDQPYLALNVIEVRAPEESRISGVAYGASSSSSPCFTADIRKSLVEYIDHNK